MGSISVLCSQAIDGIAGPNRQTARSNLNCKVELSPRSASVPRSAATTTVLSSLSLAYKRCAKVKTNANSCEQSVGRSLSKTKASTTN